MMHKFQVDLRSGRHSGQKFQLECDTDPKGIKTSDVFSAKVIEATHGWKHLEGREAEFSVEYVMDGKIGVKFNH